MRGTSAQVNTCTSFLDAHPPMIVHELALCVLAFVTPKMDQSKFGPFLFSKVSAKGNQTLQTT